MAYTWYRQYGESLHDPKIQLLSDFAFRCWNNSLSLACCLQSKDGNIGTLKSVSWAFHETEERVSSAFHELEEAGLIETVNETFHIVSWKKRQYKSDTSTERVKRHRKRSRNVSETASDTDTDTEKKERKIPPTPKGEPEGFSEFWSLYPKVRAGDKQKSMKAYAAALRKDSAAEILSGLKGYIASGEPSKEDGKYAKGCAAWLNDCRWKNNYHPQQIADARTEHEKYLAEYEELMRGCI